MIWQTMTAKQLAEKMDGREYMNEITPDEEREAYCNRLVAVFGYSDDCLEFAGYIDDEIGAFEGRTVEINHDGVVSDEARFNGANQIKAVWCPEGTDFSWIIETNIPHESFRILEDGEHFCLGIVFCIDDLK